MEQIIQIRNIDKQEFIDILERVVETKILESKKKDQPVWYSVKDLAKLLSVSELTIYNYIKKGLIPSTKVNRKHLVKREELENALKEIKSLKYRRHG